MPRVEGGAMSCYTSRLPDMLNAIFQLRVEIDRARQRRFQDHLTELASRLRVSAAEHPYALKIQEEIDLFSAAARAVDTSGLAVRAAGSPYLYRLESLPNLLKAGLWTTPIGHPKSIHEKLLKLSGGTKWLPLDEHTAGSIQNVRGFSWWTTDEALVRSPYRCAHRLGLLDEWIAVHALILRCQVDRLADTSVVRVPSALDGFCSPVFHATVLDENPAHGWTIDLDAESLRIGAPEFAVGPVDVRAVEFMPVQIDTDVRQAPKVRKGPATWKKLLRYYESTRG